MEGGGGQEGGQEHGRGHDVGGQLHQPDTAGAKAGGGAKRQEEDCRGRGPHNQLDPVGLQPLQCGPIGGGGHLTGAQI